MMKKKNQLDEMQEQKLLAIEHNGMWFAFWGLFAAIMIQVVAGTPETVLGEVIIFLCMAVYQVAACIRNGIWDRRLSPTPKTNLVISIIAGLVCAVVWFTVSFMKYHAFYGSLATGAFGFLVCVAVCYAALSWVASLYKKRHEALEKDNTEE